MLLCVVRTLMKQTLGLNLSLAILGEIQVGADVVFNKVSKKEEFVKISNQWFNIRHNLT